MAKDEYKLWQKWDIDGRPTLSCLCNTLADPGEHNDLASAHPERVAAMLKTLLEYLASVNAETVESFSQRKKMQNKKERKEKGKNK